MRCYESPKHGADIERGKVEMNIDASPAQMAEICRLMAEQGYHDTTCQEDARLEGEITCFWFIWRDQVKDFRETWAAIKKQILQQNRK